MRRHHQSIFLACLFIYTFEFYENILNNVNIHFAFAKLLRSNYYFKSKQRAGIVTAANKASSDRQGFQYSI